MRAAHAAVLREADSAVGRELGSLDLSDGRFEQSGKFQALFFRNRCPEVLDLRQMLSYEDDEGYLRNARHPGIGDQLRVERQQPGWFLGIPASCRLPVKETTDAIEFTYRVDVGDKLIRVREIPDHFELKVLLWLENANSVVPGKALEEV